MIPSERSFFLFHRFNFTWWSKLFRFHAYTECRETIGLKNVCYLWHSLKERSVLPNFICMYYPKIARTSCSKTYQSHWRHIQISPSPKSRMAFWHSRVLFCRWYNLLDVANISGAADDDVNCSASDAILLQRTTMKVLQPLRQGSKRLVTRYLQCASAFSRYAVMRIRGWNTYCAIRGTDWGGSQATLRSDG